MIEIKKKEGNTYVFSLKAESGHVLLNSIGFSDENEVKNIIKDLNTKRESSNQFERKTNHKGKFLFNLKNGKGQLIGSSQLYSSEAGMENGIKNVKNRINRLSNLDQL